MVSLRHREKLRRAVYYLAVNEGDVRELLRAADNELRVLSDDEIPENIRDELKDILHQLTKKGALFHESGQVIQTALDNTLSGIRNSTGKNISVRIYRLAVNL